MSLAHRQISCGINEVAVVHAAETIKGGIATYLNAILPLQLMRYGAGRVIVVIPRNQVHQLAPLDGLSVITFKRRNLRIMAALRCALMMRGVLRKYRVNVMHIHSTFAGIACRLLRPRHRDRPKFIYCAHGWAFDRPGRFGVIAKYFERRLCLFTDAIVCISDYERLRALRAGLPIHMLKVVLNGLPELPITLRSKSVANRGILRLLFIGRLDKQKGLDVLVEALTRVTRQFTLDVIGASVLGDQRINICGPHIRVHGWLPTESIVSHLENCDVLVVPSRWEGFGLTALEGMRSAVPVLASRVGGLAELIDEHVTGWLVPPDDPGALAAAIDAISLTQISPMGRAARQKFVEYYHVARTESTLAKVYVDFSKND